MPEDAIKTNTETIWIEDGIVIAKLTGEPTTSATVEEAFAVYRDLTKGSPEPLLLDARNWPGADAASWDTAIKNIDSTLSAIAMLVTPEVLSRTGPFPNAINQLMIPVQVFTEEAEALEFLRGHLQDEPS